MTDKDAMIEAVVRNIRCDIWNVLGHDKKIGKAFAQYGMIKFNNLVDDLIEKRLEPFITAREQAALDEGRKAAERELKACGRNVYLLQRGNGRLCEALRMIADGCDYPASIAEFILNSKGDEPFPPPAHNEHRQQKDG